MADRGFPSSALFAQLRQGGTDFSVRPRVSNWVTVGEVYATVAQAVTEYAGRVSIEETYRDWHHH